MSEAARTDHPWIATIDAAQATEAVRAWDKACDVVRKKYLYEGSATAGKRKYQLLWSNTQTMQGATYAKPPHAEVYRRYRDKDDTARQASLMLERAVNFTIDANDFDSKFRQVRDDYLLYGRGVARVIYEPVMETVDAVDDGLDGTDVEGVDAETHYEEADDNSKTSGTQEILKFEHVKIKFVQRGDFAHSPARVWDEVTWVAFRSYLDRDELIKRFGEKVGNDIGLDTASSHTANGADGPVKGDDKPKATIWEVWDKSKKKVCWVSEGHPDVLEESEPYLQFEGFFPCPKPAYGTVTNDTLIPRPDYIFYQDQAEEIDALTARIAALQESLKVVGFYPGGPAGEGSPEIERAVQPGFENKLIAVKSFAAFAEGGKGGAPIVWLPIDQVAKVLESCVKLRQQLIDDVNQIYGLSDIMRGDGDAGETATAQGIKAQYGSLRIRARHQELARFCRDIIRLVAEIICNHFQPETIMAMSNMPLPTQQDVLMQLQQQQMQAMQQAQQAAQQQAMMGHNGGPPMQGGPGMPPQGQPPMGGP